LFFNGFIEEFNDFFRILTVARNALFDAFKICDVAADTVDSKFHEDFNGLREGVNHVTDDHVSGNLERLIIALWHYVFVKRS